MLNLETIQQLAETHSPQDFFAALVWQRRFNEFDGQEVITDLAQHPELWESFLFTRPLYAPDQNGLSFMGLLETLLALANYRPMPKESIIRFVPYSADTLYILAENKDTTVAQLMDWGKKWRADEVTVCDNRSVLDEAEPWHFQQYVSLRLEAALWSEDNKRPQERPAVIVSYWWD